MVAEAHTPARPGAAIAPAPDAVLGAERYLRSLARDLRSAGALRVQGVARAAHIFGDGRLSRRTASCAGWRAGPPPRSERGSGPGL